MYEYEICYTFFEFNRVPKVTKMFRKTELAEFRQISHRTKSVEKPVDNVNNIMNNTAKRRFLHKFETVKNGENLTFYSKMQKNCDLCS